MNDAHSIVFDLIAGRWRSQAIYAAAKLGVFDVVGREPISASSLARILDLDDAAAYRLLRALGSIGLLREHDGHRFSITDTGDVLRSDHPHSLRALVLLREGPEHYAVWKHVAAIVRDGKQNGFEREFGAKAFDYAAREPSYAAAFDEGMNSYSRVQTAWVLDALRADDFAAASHVCDIGGGQGHLIAHLLCRHVHLTGTVFERPEVVEHADSRWARTLGVAERCRYVGGDMFSDAPAADAYLMKMVLHNWSDEECIDVLRVACRRASSNARLFVVEHVIPSFDTPHIAKLFDLHMLTWGTGRERSQHEYAALVERAGWRYVGARYPSGAAIGIIEAHKRSNDRDGTA